MFSERQRALKSRRLYPDAWGGRGACTHLTPAIKHE